MQIDANVLEVMYDIFSGRPNPSWFVSGKQLDVIQERITGLSPAKPLSRNILGYRGFVITNPNHLEKFPDRIVVFKGVISLSLGDKISHFKDIHNLEGYLQKMAPDIGEPQPHGKGIDLPIAAVVRIAKKSGAERVGSDAAAILIAKAEDYIANLTKEANRLALHAGRKTIKEEDVELAAKSK